MFCNYRLQSRSECFYVFKRRPSTHVRLLRHEEERLQLEAVALQILRGRPNVEVPRVIEIHSSKSPLGSPYLITGPFCGSTLSDIEPTLSRQALASVDRSLGRYVHELSRITGPYFGSMRQTTPAPQPWSRCFSGMMESVLRDAEDAMLSLPYDVINGQLRKHRSALDRISRPKLTLLEMASDKNILVHTKDMSVSGLLDFSSAIWGDPYLSDCFYQPSVSFAEGFGKLPNRTTDERVRQYLYDVGFRNCVDRC